MELQLLNGHNMILITGASKNIGEYLFEKYLSQGKDVYGTYCKTIKLTSTRLSRVDISDYQSVYDWVRSIDNLNDISLINCAGISYDSYAHKADPVEWKKVIEVNLIGTFNCIRCLLPSMRQQKFGRIINFSSVVPQKPTPGVSAYSASKSALWGLAKSISVEVGSLNITINNINLGYASLGMGVEKVPQVYQEHIKKQIPSGKFCGPEDIFQTVEFLRNTSYINGASIDLSGGLV